MNERSIFRVAYHNQVHHSPLYWESGTFAGALFVHIDLFFFCCYVFTASTPYTLTKLNEVNTTHTHIRGSIRILIKTTPEKKNVGQTHCTHLHGIYFLAARHDGISSWMVSTTTHTYDI